METIFSLTNRIRGKRTTLKTLIFRNKIPGIIFAAILLLTNNEAKLSATTYSASSTSTVSGTLAAPVNNSLAGDSCILPAGWLGADIGGVTGQSSCESNGTFTVEATGADIFGTSDQFRYTYTSLNGNGVITAKINSVENTNEWAKSGVMIRESLDADSKHVHCYISSSNGIGIQDRPTTGGITNPSTTNELAAPYWIRLERSDNEFNAYSSPDGVTWTQVGLTKTVSMATNVFIGLSLTSHAAGVYCTSVITNVSVTGTASPSSISENSFVYSWKPLPESAGVLGYEVYRDSVLAGVTTDTSMNILNLSCNSKYLMTVIALDADSNRVAANTPAYVSTLPCTATSNLALNRPVVTSSNERPDVTGPEAVDGNPSTRWSSDASDPQWIRVDLGSDYDISGAKLLWETAYAESYKIQVSPDASSWTDIYSTTTGDGDTDELTSLSGFGRYIRMLGNTRRWSDWGYSIYEFEVYGTPHDTTPPVQVGGITYIDSADYNATDATDVIQAALDSDVDTVYIKNVNKPWIVRPLFVRKDTLTVILEPGTVLQAKSGAYTGSHDCLFSVGDGAYHKVKNINLSGNGATLKMLKNEYTTGEGRHCLDLEWVENVEISGLTMYGSGGDGIYVGPNYFNSACRNIHIKDCISDNNRRQGISVIAVDGLLLENSIFKNTTGTNPMAGIDIEPDSKTDTIKDVIVRNCSFINNKNPGIDVALHQLDSTSYPVSIRFENCYVSGNIGMDFKTGNGLKGLVEFQDCLFESKNGYGLDYHAPAYTGTDNPEGNNPNKVFARFTKCFWRHTANAYHPLFFEGTKWTDPNYTIPEYGGVEFIDCVLETTKSGPFIVAENGTNSLGIANIRGNITVINPNGATMMLTSKAHDIHLNVTEIKTPAATTVDVISNMPDASERKKIIGTFTISRTGADLSLPLAVSYTLKGTAAQATDYKILKGYVMIPANEISVTDTIYPLTDLIDENTETAVISLNSASFFTLGSSSATVNIEDTVVLVTGISSNLIKSNGLTLYPNPARDHISIAKAPMGSNLFIYDQFGRIVLKAVIENQIAVIPIESLPAGLYIVKINEYTQKLIVQ